MIVPQLPVSDLQGRLQILQEEVSALKECLCASGALSHDRFLARLHRERFDRICRAHPLELDGTATLTRAFALHELTVSVVSLAGVAAVRALRCLPRKARGRPGGSQQSGTNLRVWRL